MKFCFWCGKPATHYCTGCGHWICDSLTCRFKSVAQTLGFGK